MHRCSACVFPGGTSTTEHSITTVPLPAGEGWRVVTDRYVLGEAMVATDDAEADNNIYIKKHGKVSLLLSLAVNEIWSARACG